MDQSTFIDNWRWKSLLSSTNQPAWILDDTHWHPANIQKNSCSHLHCSHLCTLFWARSCPRTTFAHDSSWRLIGTRELGACGACTAYDRDRLWLQLVGLLWLIPCKYNEWKSLGCGVRFLNICCILMEAGCILENYWKVSYQMIESCVFFWQLVQLQSSPGAIGSPDAERACKGAFEPLIDRIRRAIH